MKTKKIVMLVLVLGAAVFGLYLTARVKEPAPASGRADWLIRHLTVSDFDAYKIGAAEIEPADAIVYNQWFHDAEIETLATQGVEGWRYYNVLTAPLPDWVGGGNPWFDWADSTIVRSWGAVVKDTTGTPALFSAFGNPLIFDWSELDGKRTELIIQKQLELLDPCKSIFLDQYWLEPSDWMFKQGHPGMDVLADSDCVTWKTNVTFYLDGIRQGLEKQGGNLVIVNGERGAPPPVFLENSQSHPSENWGLSVKRWLEHPENVLSVDPVWPWPESLLVHYKLSGGMVSVTGGLVETQKFYEAAEKARPPALSGSSPN